MTFPKNKLFAQDDKAISRISFTLSHPARLFIVKTLWDQGPKFVLELERMMPLTQGSISHHLSKLRDEGLINVEELRLYNRYSLNMDRLSETLEAYESWYSEFGLKAKALGKVG